MKADEKYIRAVLKAENDETLTSAQWLGIANSDVSVVRQSLEEKLKVERQKLVEKHLSMGKASTAVKIASCQVTMSLALGAKNKKRRQSMPPWKLELKKQNC